jgi:hypothetical protein
MTISIFDLHHMTASQIAAWVAFDENQTESNETEKELTQTEV